MKKEFVKRVLLGATEEKEVVFANVTFRSGMFHSNGNFFTVSFEVYEPITLSEEVLKYRVNNLLDCLDEKTKYEKCSDYDCKPSELAQHLIEDLEVEEIIVDLEPNYIYDIVGVGDKMGLECMSCGQVDRREDIVPINWDFMETLFRLWDSYHLGCMPEDKKEDFLKALEEYENSYSEEDYLMSFLKDSTLK